MAVYFVPAEPTAPTPADGDNYTYDPPRASAYDLRPAPMRQESRIAKLERTIRQMQQDLDELRMAIDLARNGTDRIRASAISFYDGETGKIKTHIQP